MRQSKGSHRIVVNDVEYRWRASGNDGYIAIGIWPSNNIGSYICGNLKYHETWIDTLNGSYCSAGDQIVVTNRVVRRIIEHAIAIHNYDPNTKCDQLNLRLLDSVIRWDDAVRAFQSSN